MALNPYYRSQFPTAPFSENWSGLGPFNTMAMAPFQGAGGNLGEICRPMAPLMSADLIETEKGFNVHVDLPGVEDLDITIQDRALIIKVRNCHL